MGYFRRFLRDRRPSPAMVVASFALLVALGGTSVAAVVNVAANSVARRAQDNAVTTPKIKNSATSKIASNASASKIASNAVTNAKIANGTIQPADLSAAAKTSRPAGPPGRRARRARQAPRRQRSGHRSIERHAGAQQGRRVRTEERTGSYQVIFNQDVTGCSYQATPGGPTIGVCPSPTSRQASCRRRRRCTRGSPTSGRSRTRRSSSPSSANGATPGWGAAAPHPVPRRQPQKGCRL